LETSRISLSNGLESRCLAGPAQSGRDGMMTVARSARTSCAGQRGRPGHRWQVRRTVHCCGAEEGYLRC
jgi:hypothetical protein